MPPADQLGVADEPPSGSELTAYDEAHVVTYWRMLDAAAEGADWREVSRIVLCIDPAREPDRARQAYDSHLARARWIANTGYRQLLRSGWPK
ncbi:DNA -binding domain-containing protein [Bradyrhizobium pachyrhizi]|uniref:DNA -binding domain-containing protein n=1 Tax=Bradyrhizobium pachyrhizi TaxID=280333 RepID=UPI0009E49355|nr:DUF2285 domain-containing protein [Bradyrhizobium pachyrhizi]